MPVAMLVHLIGRIGAHPICGAKLERYNLGVDREIEERKDRYTVESGDPVARLLDFVSSWKSFVSILLFRWLIDREIHDSFGCR